MSPGHSNLGPELRALAQAILDRLDPALRAAAGKAAESLRGPGRCQQVWCPVCALAALGTGEEHPLLTVVAEHSLALLTVIRTMATDARSGAQAPDTSGSPDTDGSATPGKTNGAGAPGAASRANGNGHYQHIPIVIEVPGASEDWP